jgi:UDP-glucose:(heptosyl)LPS alpha-1,3-glucosyltransferase
MKLAIVRQKYTPFGGAERFVERALVALAAKGVDVTMVARQWQGEAASGVHGAAPRSLLPGPHLARRRLRARCSA